MNEKLEELIVMYENKLSQLDPEVDKEKYNLYLQEITKLKAQKQENDIVDMIAIYKEALQHINPLDEEKINFYNNEIQRLENILDDTETPKR